MTDETRLEVFRRGKWRVQETFTTEPGGREFAIERAAEWRKLGWRVRLDPPEPAEPDVAPPIAGVADLEYLSRLDAERVTAELRTKSTRRVDGGRCSIEDSPLFGGDRQGGLFDE